MQTSEPKIVVEDNQITGTKISIEGTGHETEYLHDKRYEEPFEDDGAYAEDDID